MGDKHIGLVDFLEKHLLQFGPLGAGVELI